MANNPPGDDMTDKHELIALAALASLALAGCGQPPTQPYDEQGSSAMKVWTDPKTGCRYYVWKDGYGKYAVGDMSIRFNADGTPDCPRAERERQQ